MPATLSSFTFTQRRFWLSAASLFFVANVPAIHAQDYNYPPQTQNGQQQTYGQQGYSQPGDPSQGDPPSRVARVSVTQGNVSLQPAGVEDFSPASLNYPLTTGDRIYSDNGALTELEAGQLAIRLGSATDLSVTAMTDQLEQFGLGQGSIHVRSYDLDPNATLEIDTPNVSVTMLAPGDLRVDVSPDGTMTQITLLSGQARVDGPGFQQQLQPGESLRMTGSEPVYAQDARRPRADNLDRFSSDRDRVYQDAIATQADYVNPGTIGAADLGQYGDWSNDADNGSVWYPRGVAADWQPYSYGRWAYVAPWGWTWVENEPWGFAPFHYGRWSRFGSRWGWIPGPRIVRPVYSPALVAFVGGGVGVTAWFPLGPREPYVPWYRTSSLYANRINVSNIYSRNTVEVRNIYNQRNTKVYGNGGNFDHGYANRQLATVAIPQTAFAGGRPVREVSMHLQPQQFANSPVLSRPNVTPTRGIMAPAPARALPPHMQRPPVESHGPAFQPGGANRPDRDGFAQGGFRQGGGQQNGDNRGGGFGNQPGNGTGNFPGRSGNAQQPGQPPNQQQRGGTQPGSPRSNEPGQRTGEPGQRPGQYPPASGGSTATPGQPGYGQSPNRGNGNGQGQPFRGDPGRTVSPTPVAPVTGSGNPPRGNNNGQPPTFRGDPGRTASPTPVAPVTGNPPANGNNGTGQPPRFRGDPPRTTSPIQIQSTPGAQPPTRSSGDQQSPTFRGDPGRNTSPTPIAPAPTQTPNRDGQGPVFRGAPGRTISPTPIQPGTPQPIAQPGQGEQLNPGGDFRSRSGAHPVMVPPEGGQGQQPSNGGMRPWQQQQQNNPPQNRPQQAPAQPAPVPQAQPRFQPQPAPVQQPQRQFVPQQPVARQPNPAPAGTPHEFHAPREERKPQ